MDGWMYWFGFWRHDCSRSNVALVVILEEEDSVSTIRNVGPQNSDLLLEGDGDKNRLTCEDAASACYLGSSGAIDSIPIFASYGTEENDLGDHAKENPSPSGTESGSESGKNEDFAIWQRIIRLDAGCWTVISAQEYLHAIVGRCTSLQRPLLHAPGWF